MNKLRKKIKKVLRIKDHPELDEVFRNAFKYCRENKLNGNSFILEVRK